MASSSILCNVHPVVMFSIVDAHERRNSEAKNVIGTLIGKHDKGVVEVTNCFVVPHSESEDEVSADLDYAEKMYELHRKVNVAEVIVGWFSTGAAVTEHSVRIHDYYGRACTNPIYMTMDCTLEGGKLGIKAWCSVPMGVPGKTLGVMFTPVDVKFVSYEPEKVGVDLIKMAKYSKQKTVSMHTDLKQIEKSCRKLQEMLRFVTKYVDDVLAYKTNMDNTMGRFLMDLVHSVPNIDSVQFDNMLNANMKDLLMVVYLSNLAKAQVAINEKLTSVS